MTMPATSIELINNQSQNYEPNQHTVLEKYCITCLLTPGVTDPYYERGKNKLEVTLG